MTNGNSQGLFVVVAIVIFGIFIGLSYTLFGNEGLSKDLKGTFEHSTEQVLYIMNLKNNKISVDDFKVYTSGGNPVFDVVKDNKSITFSSKSGFIHAGIYLPYTIFENNHKYILEYDMTLLEGTVNRIGGHINNIEYNKFYVNNKLIDASYTEGTPISMSVGETINVSVKFLRSNEEPINTKWVLIQPNRVATSIGQTDIYNSDYRVKISNFRLIQLD